MNRAENPQSQPQNLETDEMYVWSIRIERSSVALTHMVPRFRQKFRSFIEQYELRELHILSMMRMKDSEVHLHIARGEEQRKRADRESNKSQALSQQVATFSGTETELRGQLNIYVEKFKQVSCVLSQLPRDPSRVERSLSGFRFALPLLVVAECVVLEDRGNAAATSQSTMLPLIYPITDQKRFVTDAFIPSRSKIL